MASLEYYKCEGIKARKGGFSKSSCPCDKLSYDEADWWMAGWEQEDVKEIMEEELHPLRCETCDNYIPQQCMNGDPQCKVSGIYFESSCESFISKVGCASHSDIFKYDNHI